MTLYWRRVGWGFIMLLIGVGALFASMVRIVPQPAAPPAPAQETVLAPAPAPQPVVHPLLTVPVEGVARAAIRDTWGESRAGGARAHQGTDIIAPAGTRVVAAAAGTVEKLYFSHGGGGITLYVRSPDRRWSYYYAHLQGYAPGVAEGAQVAAGALLGYVGDTGNAGLGNYHLHFGMARMAPADRWWKGEPVNPWPLLAGSPPAP